MTQSRLNTIRILVEHPHVSLHALNAPEDAMDGVTPLGVASWLNAPEVVRILLESGAGAVSVNGLDTHRATPLMCEFHFPGSCDAFYCARSESPYSTTTPKWPFAVAIVPSRRDIVLGVTLFGSIVVCVEIKLTARRAWRDLLDMPF